MAADQDPAVPVLVLGGRITALGVIRTLSRSGIANFLISRDRWCAGRSRFYRPLTGGSQRLPYPGGLEAWLGSLTLPCAVLLPCEDNWVLEVAGLSSQLKNRFPASIADPSAIACLLDKGNFYDLLRRLEIPHPRTIPIESVRDLQRGSDVDIAGSFLKPRNSQELLRLFGVKAFQIREWKEAARIAAEVSGHGIGLTLQEYIPGPPTAHYFIDGFADRSGRVVARFARRRLRMYPPDFGNSSLHVSIPVEDVKPAADALDLLLHRLNYRGIFSAEFKLDPRDGQFKILEVNARPWWFIEFAARSGVDVCTLAYRDALGLHCDPIKSYQTGRLCVTLDLDVRSYLHLRRKKAIGLREWLRSWLGADHPVFSWSDPGPALGQLAEILWIVANKLRSGSLTRPATSARTRRSYENEHRSPDEPLRATDSRSVGTEQWPPDRPSGTRDQPGTRNESGFRCQVR